MSTRRYPRGAPVRWRVTIASADNTRLMHYAICEDLKEVQAVCTEARHASLSYQIWIKPPIGKLFPWD